MATKRTVVATVGALLALALDCDTGSLPAARTAVDRRAVDRPGTQQSDRPVIDRPGIGRAGAPGRGEPAPIHLATGGFDPLAGVPEVPGPLRARNPRHWLVQVHTPVSVGAAEAVHRAGGQVVGYLPVATYLVEGGAPVAEALRAVPAVRWVGPYHPAYKLSPALAGAPAGPVHVWAHPGADASALAGQLRAGTGVRRADVVGDRLVVVDAAPGARAALAVPDAAEWVEPAPIYRLANADARWVGDTASRGVLAVSAPGRLTGEGQVVAVADTGVNYRESDGVPAHRAFADCPPPGGPDLAPPPCLEADYVQQQAGADREALRSTRATGARHRKMAAYLAVAGDPRPRAGDGSWHGTHVAGSVAADYPDATGRYGTASRTADGIAPAARLVVQDIEAGGTLHLPEDPFSLFAQAYDVDGDGAYDPAVDARIHSNSYGGLPGLDTAGLANRLDAFVAEHPDMTVLVSASNDGPNRLTLSGDLALAKNGIIVCSSGNGGQPLSSPDAVADFSSHGPTPDGRLKPDVCTPGEVVVSTRGGTADDDHYLSGTSMSAPLMAGFVALVRQYFWDGYGPAGGSGFAPGSPGPARRHSPSAALVRALVVNSAQRMRGPATGDDGQVEAEDGMWPSAGQGFGRVQLDRTLTFPGDRRTTFVIDRPRTGGLDTGGLDTGDVAEFALDVAPGEPLAVTLAWTDPPSSLAAGTPRLVNDLDLEVATPDGALLAGNELTTQSPLLGPGGDPGAEVGESVRLAPAGAAPGAPSGFGDRVNTTEVARVADPAPGRYTVRVRGAGVALGPQGFGLVATGRLAAGSPRISPDVTSARPGTATAAYLLGTGLAGESVDGFTRMAPSIYRRALTVGREPQTLEAAGTRATVEADAGPPAVAGVEVESLAADAARIRWSTDEPSTGEVLLTTPEGRRTIPDVHSVSGYPGLTTPDVESRGAFRDRPVLARDHEVLFAGLRPGEEYRFEIASTDPAGNRGVGGGGSFRSTETVYAPDAPDMAQLRSADENGRPPPGIDQPWGRSTQLFAGRFPAGRTLPPVVPTLTDPVITLMPAFMFRLPDGLDTGRITGASVQLVSAGDSIDDNDRPAWSVDLLGSEMEAGWGPGRTYDEVDRAAADARLVPEPTVHRGGNVPYTFAVACNDLHRLTANLEGDGPGRRALAFRLRALSGYPRSIFSFETGLGHRARGLDLRPRLILTLDGADPLPCRPGEPAPAITDVLVDHLDGSSAVVSWRTDRPADSTVYFRRAGGPESNPWVPVANGVRTTQHFVRIGGLDRLGAYEFVVRSATCGGAATVDDNGGRAYALFPEAYQPPVIDGIFVGPEPGGASGDGGGAAGGGGRVVGWTTDQPASSTVYLGTAPGVLDTRLEGPSADAAHRVPVPPLAPCRIYYLAVESTNRQGRTARSPVLAFESDPGGGALAAYDFSTGPQGWSFSPANGGVTAPSPAGEQRGLPVNPTGWRPRPEPAFAASTAMRTVLRDTVPGYSAGADVRLVSPPLALPGGPVRLRFREWFLLGPGSTATVELSPDDGATWVPLREGAAARSAGFPSAAVTELAVDPALTGGTVRLAFRLVAGTGGESPRPAGPDEMVPGDVGGGWAVDDVAVIAERCPPRPAPETARAPAAPPAAPPAAASRPGPARPGPRPPVAAEAASIGPLPPPGPPGPASRAAGTAVCGPAPGIPTRVATGSAPGGSGLPGPGDAPPPGVVEDAGDRAVVLLRPRALLGRDEDDLQL